MILGIGIDLIEIDRFLNWHTYPLQRLKKIFSGHEIDYCLQEKELSAARFAARFAAKEAFYKALCVALGHTPFSFSSICSLIEVVQEEGKAPYLQINPHLFTSISPPQSFLDQRQLLLTLTHSQASACAFVIIQKNG